MTLYRLPHYGYRFFAGTHYDVLPYVVILNGDKNVLWEKRESGTVTQSEESMTLMTFYSFPHHGCRFFAGAHYDVLPYVVILNGDKNVLWEKRESGTVTQSEESMTLITFYGFPHCGSRSFAIASG